jgi:F-type H+-transporting ATPase subunit b
MTQRNRKLGAAALAAVGALAMAATLYASGGEGHGGGGIPAEKLWDLLYRVLNFAGLVVILVLAAKKPLVNALNSRRESIRTQLEELDAKRSETERVYKECEAKLAGLEAEAKAILAEAVKQGEAEKQKIITEAERAAADMKRQAEMAVTHELAVAKTRLKAEIAEQAVLVAEELIKKNLQPADQQAMVASYLDKVGGIQ